MPLRFTNLCLRLIPSLAILLFSQAEVVRLENYSFEEGKAGWTGTGNVGNKYVFAATNGDAYAEMNPGEYLYSGAVTSIGSDSTYTVTVYARSLNALGSDELSVGRVSLYADSVEIKNTEVSLNPLVPKGAATNEPNDDGGNVWFDGDYRFQAAEVVMYQSKDDDPQTDEWMVAMEVPEPANYAPGPIQTPQGLKALYATAAADGQPVADGCVDFCDECEAKGNCSAAVLPDGCKCEATIIPVHMKGNAPGYSFEVDARGPILKHSAMKGSNVYTSYFPSPGDASLHYDDDTGRLWMIWGGWTLFVTELDPATGRMLGDPDDVEVDNCINSIPSCATPVLSFANSENEGGRGDIPDGWEGDQWSAASYVEGPALFKHDGYWYAMGSYGDLDRDYTIRVCRNSSPNPNEGTFLDKDGLDCTVFEHSVKRYGCSMLLGPEGIQAVPGHPHIWKESDGRFFLGYDFRYNRGGVQGNLDFFGLRQLQWVDGWPTIWTKIELTFASSQLESSLIGSSLFLKLESAGSGVVGFDGVEFTSGRGGPTPSPPSDDEFSFDYDDDYDDDEEEEDCDDQCSNRRTPWMIRKGKECDTWIGLGRKCNLSRMWRLNKYCQRSCSIIGLGYDGDECCNDSDDSYGSAD